MTRRDLTKKDFNLTKEDFKKNRGVIAKRAAKNASKAAVARSVATCVAPGLFLGEVISILGRRTDDESGFWLTELTGGVVKCFGGAVAGGAVGVAAAVPVGLVSSVFRATRDVSTRKVANPEISLKVCVYLKELFERCCENSSDFAKADIQPLIAITKRCVHHLPDMKSLVTAVFDTLSKGKCKSTSSKQLIKNLNLCTMTEIVKDEQFAVDGQDVNAYIFGELEGNPRMVKIQEHSVEQLSDEIQYIGFSKALLCLVIYMNDTKVNVGKKTHETIVSTINDYMTRLDQEERSSPVPE